MKDTTRPEIGEPNKFFTVTVIAPNGMSAVSVVAGSPVMSLLTAEVNVGSLLLHPPARTEYVAG